MKPNLFLYLTAGFNVGALSSLLIRAKGAEILPSKKEIVTMVLSGLAAASSVGFLLSKQKSEEDSNEDFDMKEDTARKMETFLA